MSGELQGVKITEDVTICHRLFADDLGIFIPADEGNFHKLQSILNIYETAAGAKMNFRKTIIIPLSMNSTPQWIHDTGCKISGPGEIQRYLGAPIGYQIKQSNMHSFCLDKISKRIAGWSNRLLSFTGKTILIQHVLQSITIYHMMQMATPGKIAKLVNQIFKDFLWGFDSKTGRRKIPLVAWSRLIQPKEHGSLGFKDYMAHADALLSRWVAKVLEDTST